MPLSDRLQAVANMITPGLPVADIGCDHGYLAIYLIREGISPRVIAMDIGKGPLERAIDHVREAGLEGDIETRLSDGLDKLEPGEAESIVMAGMGGRLMIDIMSRGEDKCEGAHEFILQPQSEVDRVRHFLEDKGYRIISEDIVFEDDKYYPVIKAVHGEMKLSKEVYYRYGKILLHEEHPVLRSYLHNEKRQLKEILNELNDSEETDRVKQRIEEVKADIELVNEALRESEERV